MLWQPRPCFVHVTQFFKNCKKLVAYISIQHIYVVLELHNCIRIVLNDVLDLDKQLVVNLNVVLNSNELIYNINLNDVLDLHEHFVINFNIVFNLYQDLHNVNHNTVLDLLEHLPIVAQLYDHFLNIDSICVDKKIMCLF